MEEQAGPHSTTQSPSSPSPQQKRGVFTWDALEPPKEACTHKEWHTYLTPIIKKPMPLTMPDMSLPAPLSDAGYPLPGGLPPWTK